MSSVLLDPKPEILYYLKVVGACLTYKDLSVIIIIITSTKLCYIFF